MKVFIALAALCVCAQASLLPAATIATKLVSTGESSQSRTQDAAGNYAFAYNEQHSTGGSSRKEAGDSWGNKQGSYTLNVADGRQRVVKYVADGLGFRAAISTNEPGTAAQPAADTSIASPYLPPAPVQPLAEPAPALALGYGKLAAAPLAAPLALAEPAPALALGYGKLAVAPLAAAPLAAPLALAEPAPALGYAKLAVVPAVSSYSTSINHGAALAEPIGHLKGLY